VCVDSRFTLVSLFRGSHFRVWIQELHWPHWSVSERGFKHYISKSFVACTLNPKDLFFLVFCIRSHTLFRVRGTMSQPETPTWSQQPMSLKSYKPCFVDVRRAVIAYAEDQNFLALKPRT